MTCAKPGCTREVKWPQRKYCTYECMREADNLSRLSAHKGKAAVAKQVPCINCGNPFKSRGLRTCPECRAELADVYAGQY